MAVREVVELTVEGLGAVCAGTCEMCGRTQGLGTRGIVSTVKPNLWSILGKLLVELKLWGRKP